MTDSAGLGHIWRRGSSNQSDGLDDRRRNDDDERCGDICDVPPSTYRKRLSRARARVREFLSDNCGLASSKAACHCSKRVDVAVRLGRVDPARLEFTDTTTEANDELIRLHDAAHLLRALPAATLPTPTAEIVTRLIRNSAAARATCAPQASSS